MKKLSGIFPLVLLWFTNARAQAPVPVVDEPRHKVVFSNEYVRLIDVWINPGDTTLYHRHATASAIVFLSKTATGSQPLGGSPSSGQSVPGNSFFAPYQEKPITHRVWNQDTVVYHVMDIEVLKPGSPDPGPVLAGNMVRLNFDQPMVRSYTIDIPQGKSLEVPASSCAHLLIAISGESSNKPGNPAKTAPRSPKAGQYEWFAAGKPVHLENNLSGPLEYVLLELK
jgi:hypothetical protein